VIQRIDKYEIKEEIGHGGFGTVYRAFDPGVGRPVAIKVLTAGGDPELLARFRNEATAAGNLHHPNIVTIYEFGEYQGLPYLVMELLTGHDLQKSINAGQLSLYEKVGIMQQVARGVHYAHEHGVVHRDIKPANIMVLTDGTVKIMDFGIARLTQGDVTRQTRTGYLVGTVHFMSPEQIQDARVDALCDVWAFGVVYYELLTGQLPFRAADQVSLMYKIVNTEPARLRTLVPSCPEALENIVHRALTKDREARYQNLEDLQIDVGPILNDLQRQQASKMLAWARGRFENGRFDEAQAAVRHVLEMDPASAEARQLRESIAKQLQRQQIRPQVEALVRSANECMERRQFVYAVEHLRNALRLEPGSSAVIMRMDEAQRLADAACQAAELLTKAEKDLQELELTRAYRCCTDALDLDPENPNAKELLNQVLREIGKREREKKLEEQLNRIRGLLLMQAFDEAIGGLKELRLAHPDNPDVRQLLTRAEVQKAEVQQRNRLKSELDAATAQLKEGRFADAVARLRVLKTEYEGDDQLSLLLAFAEDELRSQQKADAVARISDEVQTLVQDQQFEQALRLLDDGLQKSPRESGLTQLLQSTLAGKSSFERQQTIDQAVRRCEQLRQEGRLADAVPVLDAAINRCGAEQVLVRLRKQLAADLEKSKRVEAIRKAAEEAKPLIAGANPGEAVRLLQAACGQYSGEPELEGLLALALEAKQKQDRARDIGQQLARVEQLEKSGQLEAALAAIAAALERYPDSNELAAAKKRLQERLTRQKELIERDAIYRDSMSAAERAFAKRQFDEAANLLHKALQCRPGDAHALGLLEAIARDTELEIKEQVDLDRSRYVNDQLVRAAKLERAGQVEAALAVIGDALERYPDSAELAACKKRLQDQLRQDQRSKEIAWRTRLIKQALAANDLAKASELLSAAQREFQGETDFGALVNELEAARNRTDFDKLLLEIQDSIIAGDLKKAGSLIRAGQETYGDQPRLARLRELFERETCYWESLAAAKRDFAQRQFDGAADRLHRALECRPADAEATSLLDAVAREAEVEIKKQERLRAINEQMARAALLEKSGQTEPALAVIASALDLYPDAAELLQAHARLQERHRQDQRRTEIARRTRQIEQALAANDLARASELLAAAQREFQGETDFGALVKELEAARNRAGLDSLLTQIQDSIAAGDLKKAGGLIKTAVRNYGDQPRLGRLKELFDRETAYRESLAAAKRALGKRQVDEAGNLLHKALECRPNDPEAVALLDSISREGPSPVSAEPQRRISPKVWAAALAALAVVVLGTVWLWPKEGRLQVSTAPLAFSWTKDEAAPDTKQLRVVSSPSPSPFTVSGSAEWLSVAPPSGSTPGNLSISVKPQALAPRKYNAAVKIQIPGRPGTAQEIPVSLVVNSPPIPPESSKPRPARLDLRPVIVDLKATEGDPFSDSKDIRIAGDGAKFRATANQTWLRINPREGSTPGTVTARAQTASLTAGEHRGKIEIEMPGNPGTQSIADVRLTVARRAVSKLTEPKPTAGAGATPSPVELNPPPPPPPNGTYGGSQHGTFVWVGELKPNEPLVLGPKGVSSTGRILSGKPIPGVTPVTVTVDVAGVNWDTSDYRKLVLINGTDEMVSQIKVKWYVKQ
jgi:serine/threonine-protein kinase